MKRDAIAVCLAAGIVCQAGVASAQQSPDEALSLLGPGMTESLSGLLDGSMDFSTHVETLLPLLEALDQLGVLGPAPPEIDGVRALPSIDLRQCDVALSDPAAEDFAIGLTGDPAALEPFSDVESLKRLYDLMMRVPGLDPCSQAAMQLGLAGALSLRGELSEASAIYAALLPPFDDGDPPGAVILMAYAAQAAIMLLQRRDEEALALFEALRAPMAERFGSEGPQSLAIEGALGDLSMRMGEYDKALKVFKEQSDVLPRALGRNHPLVCINKLSLGWVSLLIGQSQDAEQPLQDVLDPSDPACGPLLFDGHPWHSRALRLRGAIHVERGDHRRARADFTAALDASAAARGDTDPQTLEVMLALAELEALDGDLPATIALLGRLDEALLSWLGGEVQGTSQRSARRRLVADQRQYQEIALRLALAHPDNLDLQRLAAEAIIRHKGIQGEEEAALSRLLRGATVPAETRALAKDVARQRTKLAAEFARSMRDQAATAPGDAMALIGDLEESEAALARASGLFARRAAVLEAGLDGVQAGLAARPRPAVLVEFRIFDLRQIGALTGAGEPRAERLAAVVIDAEQTRVVDLGAMSAINGYLEALTNEAFIRRSVQNAAAMAPIDPTTLAAGERALYQSLIYPLAIGSYSIVYLSPDGALNLLPFGALRVNADQHWIEDPDLMLEVLQSGRALVPQTGDVKPASGIVALGGADFGDGDPFAELPASAGEASRVMELFTSRTGEPGVPLLGKEATETALRSMGDPPRVLHLATHGFYENLDEASTKSNRPLVLSGIALEGANLGREGDDDGILYAIEAQDLNLDGTDLVVLSACKTGQGFVERGEGLHGLTRAFGIAGARYVLVALRPVNDSEARVFSEAFYSQWLAGDDADPASAFNETVRGFLSERSRIDWRAFALYRTRA